jgi:hypothetical protein
MHREALSAAASAEEKSNTQREVYNASSPVPSTSGRASCAGDAIALEMHINCRFPQKLGQLDWWDEAYLYHLWQPADGEWILTELQ